MEIEGRTAQIDHLLIHRTMHVFVFETKSFHAGVKINEDGEFLRWNDWKKAYEGMPSPLAQNDRHILVLEAAMKQLALPTRLGVRMEPTFHSLVLVSPSARIDRPRTFDTSRVIKADTLDKTVTKTLEAQNLVGAIARLIGAETLEAFAKDVAGLHQTHQIDYAAPFGTCEKRGRLFVATSKPRIFAERFIERFGLANHFSTIYGSELDGRLSDKSELIAHALAKSKLPPNDTAMIGDRRHDIAGALSNGVFAAGALWGYGSREELTVAGAQKLFTKPSELEQIVV